MGERGMERIWHEAGGGEDGPWWRGKLGVGEERCGYWCEGDKEGGAEVCAEAGDEARGGGEGYFFFDVEVEAIELILLYEGVQGAVVGFELCV
jgi:hypothetical protein